METKIRERLLDLAMEAPKGIDVPPTLGPRAHRRMALTLAACVCVVAVVAAGTFVGARLLGNGSTQPAHKTPSRGIFEQARGWIAIGTQQGIVAINPADPTETVSLGSSSLGTPIGWSGDGARLLLRRYEHRGANLYVLNSDGSETPVTHDGSAFWGSLSPDGARVVYWTERTGSLYLIDANGGSPRLLAAGNHDTALVEPEWSPDGSTIAFFTVTNPLRGPWAVSVVNADGTGQRVLVDLSQLPVTESGGLAWSPDGSQLAFFIDPTKYHGQIWVVGADGSGLRRLTHGGDNVWPAWSPDGSRIAFVHGGALFTMNADGTGLKKVGDVQADWAIAWNPIR